MLYDENTMGMMGAWGKVKRGREKTQEEERKRRETLSYGIRND